MYNPPVGREFRGRFAAASGQDENEKNEIHQSPANVEPIAALPAFACCRYPLPNTFFFRRLHRWPSSLPE
jgi:hypothetical protein